MVENCTLFCACYICECFLLTVKICGLSPSPPFQSSNEVEAMRDHRFTFGFERKSLDHVCYFDYFCYIRKININHHQQQHLAHQK